MKTKAAILWERNTPWSVEEIELDPPKANEVLVKFTASGMCHSDEHMVTGDMAMDPAIVDHPDYGSQMADALRALPALSLVTDVANLDI